MRRLVSAFALVLFLGFAMIVTGQVASGTPSWSAYDSGQYDTINLQNLNVSLNVPVMTKSGAFPFKANLVGGDSYFSYNGTSLQPGILAQPITPSINGILSPFGYTQVLAGHTASVTCPSGDGTGPATLYSKWYLLTTDGTVHSLPSTDVAYGGASCSSTLTDQVIDGPGWTVTVAGGTYNAGTQAGVTVVSSGGLTINIATATIHDAQSTPNQIQYGYPFQQEFIDTLGREVLIVNPNAAGQLEWFDVNGGSPTVSQTGITPALKTSFGCSGKADYPATVDASGLTTAVSFPDGTSLGLAWEPNEVTTTDYTGRLAQITMRDGVSKVSFNYNPANAGTPYNFNCTYLMPNSMTRTTSDGTVAYTLAFSLISGSNYKETNTKIDAGGNKTVYTFTGLTSSGNSTTYAQVLTQKQYYINTNTVASPSYGTPTTVVYCYNITTPIVANCPTAQVTLPITELDTYTQPSGMSSYARQTTQFDGGPGSTLAHYGNVTYSAERDFAAGQPSTTTTIVYGSSSGSGSCTSIPNNINNKPCTVSSTLNGNVVASSQYTYDSYGNLLKTYVSPNGGTSFLSNATASSYNSNGTPIKIYDLANNETDYAYLAGNYSDGTCTNPAFPTGITNAATGLSTSYTYDCTGGVKLSATDPSGNETTYGYDGNCGSTADPWW